MKYLRDQKNEVHKNGDLDKRRLVHGVQRPSSLVQILTLPSATCIVWGKHFFTVCNDVFLCSTLGCIEIFIINCRTWVRFCSVTQHKNLFLTASFNTNIQLNNKIAGPNQTNYNTNSYVLDDIHPRYSRQIYL